MAPDMTRFPTLLTAVGRELHSLLPHQRVVLPYGDGLLLSCTIARTRGWISAVLRPRNSAPLLLCGSEAEMYPRHTLKDH